MGNRWIPTADRLPDQRGAYGRFLSRHYWMTRIEGIICRRNEAEKSSGEIDSSIMRNWRAGMMQRRWRDSEDQHTRV